MLLRHNQRRNIYKLACSKLKMAKPAESMLPDGAQDTVSALCWPSDAHIVSSSWDGSVRLHSTDGAPVLKSSYSHKAAVLSVAAASANKVYSGGLDMAVRVHDWQSGVDTIVGSHSEAVKSLAYSSQQRVLVSGSWDKTLQVWDDRTTGSASIAKLQLPDKCYSLSISSHAGSGHLLVAATGPARMMNLYDMRKLASAETASSALIASRESSMKHQTRAVAAFLDGDGFATASVEGRVAVDFVSDEPAVQANKYAFKCHRRKLPAAAGAAPGSAAEEEVFPVNALAVHPVYGTLATGGSDGTVATWDWQAKKRLAAYSGYSQAVTALAFNPSGTVLAIATGYDWSKGESGVPSGGPGALAASTEVRVRAVGEAEVKPKAVAASGGQK